MLAWDLPFPCSLIQPNNLWKPQKKCLLLMTGQIRGRGGGLNGPAIVRRTFFAASHTNMFSAINTEMWFYEVWSIKDRDKQTNYPTDMNNEYSEVTENSNIQILYNWFLDPQKACLQKIGLFKARFVRLWVQIFFLYRHLWLNYEVFFPHYITMSLWKELTD